jgi:23S rRNA (uracil1939-C5)-methyltransferase
MTKQDVVEITALAAGGDGVGRDDNGRVTFVPRTAPGDRVRVNVVDEKKSFARGELVELVTPSPSRVVPPCEAFVRGCGGCDWLHVARAAQLEAKQTLVANALRGVPIAIERIADPCSPLGWRRRARFHVEGGKLGLYAYGSQRVVTIAHCPQLEPQLDAAIQLIASRTPPDGELSIVLGHAGAIAFSTEHAWKGAALLVGKSGIVGALTGKERHGEPSIEIEPGLVGGARDFQQASAAGNAALIALVRAAVGRGPGELVELYAGAGNFTRSFVADGWSVFASDVARSGKRIEGAAFSVATAEHAVTLRAKADVVVLDPPRAGAAEAIDGIAKLAPKTIVYVSCDPATLARDLARLVAAGYRAERGWPVDLMPQTSHVEVVAKLVR